MKKESKRHESSESPMREKHERAFRKEPEYAAPQRPVAGYKKAAKSQSPKK